VPEYLVRIVYLIFLLESKVFNKLEYFVQILGNVPAHDAVEMRKCLD